MNKFFTKKRRLLVLIFLVVPLLLAGCKKNTTPDGTSNEPVTLIWWNLFEPEENVRPMIEAYTALHPNVTIEYAERDLEDYRDLLESNLTDGLPRTGPDIFTVHNTWAGQFEDFISPAPSSVIPPADFQNNFYSFVSDDFIGTNGLVIGVPLGVDTIAIIYNKDLLENNGYTVPASDWDDFKLQARDLTKRNDNGDITTAGFSAAIPDNTEFAFDLVNLLMVQSGGSILNSDETAATFGADDDILGAMSFYLDFIDSEDGSWDELQAFDAGAFLNGDLAMYAAPSWRLLDIIKYNDQYNLNLNFDTISMPQLENLSDNRFYWPTYWGQTVSRDSASPDTAWDFLNFISQPEQLRAFNSKAAESRSFGEIYPRTDMASELSSTEYLGAYMESLPFGKTWYMVDGDQVKSIFSNMLDTTTSTAALSSNLLDAQDQVNLVFENKGTLGSQQ